MKILVTGSSGYIGRHLVERLLENGHEVIAADKEYKMVKNHNQKITYVDKPIFSGSQTIYKDLGSPDACIHLAWQNGFQHNDDAHIENLAKHYIFVRDMLKGGLSHFVGMGTMHEVGYREGAIDESTPANPLSKYGVAKNCARQFCELLTKEHGAVFQWIRAFYITGDDKNSCSIFHKILLAEEAGQKEFPFTSGKNKYDFIDVDELANQMIAVVNQRKVTGIINCCSGSPAPLGERVEQFIQENNLSIKLRYNAFMDRPYDSPAVWGDDRKIRKILRAQSS